MNIKIRNATENNLKNVSVAIPRNKLVSIIGVSGSGKSSLAYNIIYNEGQRQFLESISTFAARLLKTSQRANFDEIQNLSPTISIDQKRLRDNPRSTVGTVTEIYSYLRLLFSRAGSVSNLSAGHFSFNNPKGACKECKGLGVTYEIDPMQVVDFNKSLAKGASNHNNYKPGARLYNVIKSSDRLDMNKKIKDYTEDELYFLLYTPRIEMSSEGQGFVQRFSHEGIITRLKKRAKDLRGTSLTKEKTDRPLMKEVVCSKCDGSRLDLKVLESKINGKNIGDYVNIQIDRFIEEIKKIKVQHVQELSEVIIRSAQDLLDLNLSYLTLNRSISTLSGGESQRIKTAREIGNNLIEMIYVVDEPTAGLHAKDRENIIEILKKIRDGNNTVIAIEHNSEVIINSDYIIEVGPGAGTYGGEILFEGSNKEILHSENSITRRYLEKKTEIKKEKDIRIPKTFLKIKDANIHNLKNITCSVPLGVLCSVSGVSGSGKSSLIIDTFAKEYREKVVVVNQKQMSGFARGNLVTYVGIFNDIRKLLAQENNTAASIFSFNSNGACPDCGGIGYNKIDMHFMGDVKLTCETCAGKRYKKETLQYQFKNKNIAEILDLTVDESLDFFDEKKVLKRLSILKKVGLGYLKLGQSHDTLSGGEKQRLKLASELHKKGEIYVLDEPTAGLHPKDIEFLLVTLNELVDAGNTVIAIEHNLDFIRQSDWIIDMGPEGGNRGGEILAEGSPFDIMKSEKAIIRNYL